MGGFQADCGLTQQESGFGYNGRFFTESYSDGLVAHAGGGQANALQLPSMFNTVTTVATVGDSVQLPPSQPGLSVCVTNTAALALQVFAQVGSTDTINSIAGATGVPVIGNSVVFFQCTKPGAWTAQGLGYGNYVNGPYALDTVSTQTGITAHAGGGQASATQLTASQCQISTCATIGDSVKLPPSQAGTQITVVNNGAASANVFPATGEQINSGGANVASALAVTTPVIFYCFTAGNWVTK